MMLSILPRCIACFQRQSIKRNNFFKRTISLSKPCANDEIQFRKTRIKYMYPEKTEDKICVAYCTSESYIFDKLKEYFIKDSPSYTLGVLPKDASDVLYAKKQNEQNEDSDIFLFRRLGAFVCWNVPETEIVKLRQVFRAFEFDSYPTHDVDEESEMMTFATTTEKPTHLVDGDIFINTNGNDDTIALEKLAFSNAMALSVKLNIWELSLDDFSLSLRYIPEVLRRGYKVQMSRKDVLQKIGELLTLRHQINLYSDLLTTPDFYWDREELERLYTKTCTYLEVSKRTKVMNEKLNLCSELVEMLRSHLNEQHSHRLEWMIIVLITIEILFEVIHLSERWLR